MQVNTMQRVLRTILGLAMLAAPLCANAKPVGQNTPIDDYASAERALEVGQIDVGLKALERAATQNGLRAQLRLGKIYRDGKIVRQDDVKACQLFGDAADGHSTYDPKHPAAPLVGEAFRNWALCYVKSAAAPGSDLNMTRAAELFYQAGVIFADTPALYELATLYLSGEGTMRNPALAVFHLYTAARKRYPPAQARLGTLLWEGALTKRKAGPGLALLILAKEGAAPEDRSWISSSYDDAILTASAAEEAEGVRLANEWRSAYLADPSPAPEPEDESIPLPHRSPTRAVPGALMADGQRNAFSNQQTGASVPANSAPGQ